MPSNSPSTALLKWYDNHRRILPWRAAAGMAAQPYPVWLSEIMLQQTTVATVIPYFNAFLTRWPTILDLAKADLDEVLHAWQGLGYYARARNLHKCAQTIANELDGNFPTSEDALRALPGIGIYTAAAIAAIAYGQPTTPVDGNIERVMARYFAVTEPLPGAKPQLHAHAVSLTPSVRAGDHAQALMDLGATICTPKLPTCLDCPLNPKCLAAKQDDPTRFPYRKAKAKKPTRYGTAFWITDPEGRVFIQRRPEQGLLGGMMEFPSTDWRSEAWTQAEAVETAPLDYMCEKWLPGSVRHTFTHFHLILEVCLLGVNLGKNGSNNIAISGIWCLTDRLGDHALPTVMKKIAGHVIECNHP